MLRLTIQTKANCMQFKYIQTCTSATDCASSDCKSISWILSVRLPVQPEFTQIYAHSRSITKYTTVTAEHNQSVKIGKPTS